MSTALFPLSLQAPRSFCTQVSIPYPALGQTPLGLPSHPTHPAADSPFLIRTLRDRSSQQLCGV